LTLVVVRCGISASSLRT
jgi:hypothetical protein